MNGTLIAKWPHGDEQTHYTGPSIVNGSTSILFDYIWGYVHYRSLPYILTNITPNLFLIKDFFKNTESKQSCRTGAKSECLTSTATLDAQVFNQRTCELVTLSIWGRVSQDHKSSILILPLLFCIAIQEELPQTIYVLLFNVSITINFVLGTALACPTKFHMLHFHFHSVQCIFDYPWDFFPL